MRKRHPAVLALLVAGIVSIGSMAYASHSFSDVPDEHTFHKAVEWMKDSDITIGCNPPANTEFCPDEGVTRGEIAAFFARAASSRTFDAGTLDGLDSTDFVRQGEPVGDSDLLDGKDSTEFLSSAVSVEETTESVALGALDITVDCDAGALAIGGGFESDGGLGVNVTDNHPTSTGWHVGGTVSIGGTITVYAICASTG